MLLKKGLPGLAIAGFALAAIPGLAQTARRDTTNQARLNAAPVIPDTLAGELILEEIFIQGRVEKPGVIILPKRVEPELGDVELERSFKREVKEGTGDIPKPEKELGQVDRVKSIKKTVERKRKES